MLTDANTGTSLSLTIVSVEPGQTDSTAVHTPLHEPTHRVSFTNSNDVQNVYHSHWIIKTTKQQQKAADNMNQRILSRKANFLLTANTNV